MPHWIDISCSLIPLWMSYHLSPPVLGFRKSHKQPILCHWYGYLTQPLACWQHDKLYPINQSMTPLSLVVKVVFLVMFCCLYMMAACCQRSVDLHTDVTLLLYDVTLSLGCTFCVKWVHVHLLEFPYSVMGNRIYVESFSACWCPYEVAQLPGLPMSWCITCTWHLGLWIFFSARWCLHLREVKQKSKQRLMYHSDYLEALCRVNSQIW